MQHRALIAALCLCAAGPAIAEDDGEDFLKLMRKPSGRDLAQRYIDNAANKWTAACSARRSRIVRTRASTPCRSTWRNIPRSCGARNAT